LLDTALRLPCNVMISHYPHQMYAHALRDWRSFTFDAQTRGGSRAKEQVWCNYDEPAELHDARFVGSNKRERERVRRRVRNWVEGLDRMLPDERQAVLDAIAGRFIERLPTPQNYSPV
jgi:DNA adenine methylase